MDLYRDGWFGEFVEKIIAERNKEVDSVILGEIKRIAVDNVIETKIILNEKNVVEALRNYQDGYASIKAEAAREIFDEIEKILINSACMPDCVRFVDIDKIAELKKKYTEELNGR